jgi:hypothetical protein
MVIIKTLSVRKLGYTNMMSYEKTSPGNLTRLVLLRVHASGMHLLYNVLNVKAGDMCEELPSGI